MKNKLAIKRREIYPWDGDTLVDILKRAHPNFPYKDQFAELFLEAYHAYEAGCPHASIITAGEAFLRIVYDRIIHLLSDGKEIKISKGKRLQTFNADSPIEVIFNLTDEMTFCEAIYGMKNANIFAKELIDKMFVIKDLRNRATHGELPLLDDWDPDESDRDWDETWKIITKGEKKFPEGYRFIGRKGSSEWNHIDIKKYQCNSLKPLPYKDRFAVIQMLLVIEVITEMSDINISK